MTREKSFNSFLLLWHSRNLEFTYIRAAWLCSAFKITLPQNGKVLTIPILEAIIIRLFLAECKRDLQYVQKCQLYLGCIHYRSCGLLNKYTILRPLYWLCTAYPMTYWTWPYRTTLHHWPFLDTGYYTQRSTGKSWMSPSPNPLLQQSKHSNMGWPW